MSYAINQLGLNQPPATLQRLGNVNVRLWRVVCDCGERTKPHPLMSLALAEHHWHADMHRVQYLEYLRAEKTEKRRAVA